MYTVVWKVKGKRRRSGTRGRKKEKEMKKTWIIGLIITALTALAIGITVPALAYNPAANTLTPPETTVTGDYHFGVNTLARVADSLGLTTEELTARLQNGETLAQIAATVNVTEETLIETLIAPYADQLELRVRYEYLTREQADELLQTAR